MKSRLIVYVLPFLAPLAAGAALAPSLFLHVDTVAKEYYLSGSATGVPEEDFFSGSGQISWDNGQPLDGGFTELLSQSAFVVTGNTASSFILFLHGNGNVNGAMDFDSSGATTLTGDSNLRFDYSFWSSVLIAELEDKASSNEVIPVAAGGETFAIQFAGAAIPESSAFATLAGAAVLGCAMLRRRCRK